MLRTYFLQKFRKAAPYLVVLQLFVFVVFLVYQKYSESEVPELEGRSHFLYDNSHLWGNELFYEVEYLEHRLLREGVGMELVKTAKEVLSIADKYLEKIYFFQGKINEITKESNSAMNIQQKMEIEQKLLKTARIEKWNEQIEQYIQGFREEVKQKTLFLNGLSDYEKKEKLEELLYSEEALRKLGLKQNFQSRGHIELTLSMVQMILTNIAKKQVNLIHGQIAIDSIIFDESRAEVVPTMKTLHQGETFEASIFLSHRPSFVPQFVVVEGDTLRKDIFDRGVYRTKTKEVGTHSFEGSITAKNRVGKTMTYTFEHRYTVLPKCN